MKSDMESTLKVKSKFGHLMKLAVLTGSEIAVRAHLKVATSANIKDEDGVTPLMLAASKGITIFISYFYRLALIQMLKVTPKKIRIMVSVILW